MSFSLIYICCSFRGGILSVVFPAVAICFWPAGNLECPCLFSDLILFPFLLLFFYIVPYPCFSSMSFSLIYICCSFRGGILSAVFPTVAICFWPAGNLECPCLFSDLILFLFLLLFFYIVPYPSFSSMSFSLIYICCSFRGGILSVVFPTVAICFWPAGNLECPCLFSDLILFPFLLLFFYIVPYPSFSSMSFSLIYICCSFRGGILSAVFPTVAICFWPAGNLECPCLFSDFTLFPFLLLFFYIVPYPFLFFYVYVFFIDLYLLLFPGRHSICCFPHCSHVFLTRRKPGVPLSLFRPYPLPFSLPFLLYCSLPFLFFYVFFVDLIPEDVFILCIGFFTDSGRCFWGRNYRLCILCIPSGYIYIYILIYIYTRVFVHICTTWRGKHSNCWNAGKHSNCWNACKNNFKGEPFYLRKCW